MGIQLTTEKFIELAVKVHGNKYNYFEVNYINSRTKIIINCPIHGNFEQTPNNHLRKHGCSKCCLMKKPEKIKCGFVSSGRLTTEEFIINAKKKFGDKYNYDKVNYQTAIIPIVIICYEHGEFIQTPNRHLCSKIGCPKCGFKYLSDINKTITTSIFIERANKIHNGKYNYEKVKYINYKSKVIIICSKHGEFKQNAGFHLKGSGCFLCSNETNANTKRLGIEKFLVRAKNIHGNKYNYDKVNYVGKDFLVDINCPIHGNFKQSPHNHCRNKAGCPVCKESKGEKEIRNYLINNNIKFESQYKFSTCKNKQLLPFDFVIWQQNQMAIIEFNGQQHYVPMGFGSKNPEEKFKRLERSLINDKIKSDWCKENNIPLLVIPYTDFNKINEILENYLASLPNLNKASA